MALSAETHEEQGHRLHPKEPISVSSSILGNTIELHNFMHIASDLTSPYIIYYT